MGLLSPYIAQCLCQPLDRLLMVIFSFFMIFFVFFVLFCSVFLGLDF